MKKLLTLSVVVVFIVMGIAVVCEAEHPTHTEPRAKKAGVESCEICAAGECAACAAKDYEVSHKNEDTLGTTEAEVKSQIKAVKKQAASKKPKDHPAH